MDIGAFHQVDKATFWRFVASPQRGDGERYADVRSDFVQQLAGRTLQHSQNGHPLPRCSQSAARRKAGDRQRVGSRRRFERQHPLSQRISGGGARCSSKSLDRSARSNRRSSVALIAGSRPGRKASRVSGLRFPASLHRCKSYGAPFALPRSGTPTESSPPSPVSMVRTA